MSLILRKLCNSVLLEHFGPIVGKVADYLFRNGTRNIGFIHFNTKLPLVKIREALCILIKFDFVTFEKTDKGLVYSLDPQKVIRILRYPRYMYFVKTTCGDEAEMMVEEIFKSGYETASQVIVKTFQRLEQFPPERRSSIPVLLEKFNLLVKNQFLMHSIASLDTNEIPKDEKPNFNLPKLNIKSITRIIQGLEADPGDNDIYWKANFDRFAQDLRDQILVSAMAKRIDNNASDLMRQLLFLMYLRTASWENTSNPIPFTEIKEAIKKLDYPILLQYLDQYLVIMEEDSSKFINRVGDSGGGQYVVNMKEAFCQLVWAILENLVMEKFGSKAARIFRLIRNHRFIDQEKIQQIAMIPAKEAKHLTYSLLEENYIQIQELKKAGMSTTPTKIFFLFHIDLNQVVRMEIEHCYHALYNTLQRRDHEIISNKRQFEKYDKLEVIISAMKEQGADEEQIKEYSEMMTPSEKQHVEKVQERIMKLSVCEFNIDDTLFVLQMYVRYHN